MKKQEYSDQKAIWKTKKKEKKEEIKAFVVELRSKIAAMKPSKPKLNANEYSDWIKLCIQQEQSNEMIKNE